MTNKITFWLNHSRSLGSCWSLGRLDRTRTYIQKAHGWLNFSGMTSTRSPPQNALVELPLSTSLNCIHYHRLFVPIGATEPIKFDEVRGGVYFDLLETTHDKIMRYGEFD